MEYHEQASSTFSRKLSTGRGMPGKHAYDGVFGNPGKLGNRVEDYREIFSGSQTCSIPILDVPELHDGKVAVDAARSTRVDYANIFGGFGDGDCGVSFEDLLAKPKEVTRTAAEAGVCSAQSGHSVFQREKVVPSSEASLESFHGVKQFNMSYHKTNPGSKNGSNGLTHIAELHAVPGYTCLIDENVTSSKTEDGRLARSVLDDSKLNINVEELIKRDKSRRKVVSGPQPRVAAENISRSHADLRKKSTRNKSISNDMSFDAFGFGIGESPSSATPVSKLASNVGNHKDVSSRSTFGADRNGVSEGKPGNYSPPSLDEEVDSNSAAAASAAAVRKAIEEAQLKIKIAKQLMERKREGFRSRAKSSSKNGLKPYGKPEVKSAEKGNGSKVKEAQEMCEKKGIPGQAFAKMAEHNLMKAREAMLDVRSEKGSAIHKNAFEQRHSSESNSTLEDYMVKEVDDFQVTRECFKPVIPKEVSATQLQFEQADNEKKMMASAKESEMDQNMTAEERFQNPKECGNNFEAFEGAPTLGNVEIKLNSTEGAFEDMFTDDVKSVQEFPNQEEHKDDTQVVPGHKEANQTHGAFSKADNCQKELEILHETKDNVKNEIKEFDDPRESNGMHGWTEIENIQSKAENQVEIDKNLDEAPVNEGNMGGLDELHGQKQNHSEDGEPRGNVECERMPDGDCREETVVDACSWQEPWDCEKSGEAHAQEVAKMKFNEISYKDENENPFTEDDLVEENEKLEETKENEKMLERNYEMNKAESKQEKNLEEATVVCSEMFQRVEGDDNLESADDVHKQDENEYLVSSGKAYTCESGEAHMVHSIEGNGITEAYFESQETVKESEAAEEANDLEGEEKFEDAELNHDEKAADVTEALVIGNSWVHLGETDMNYVDSVYNVRDYSHEKHAEEMLYFLDETGKDVNESTVCPSDEEKEVNSESENEKCLDRGIESPACNNLEEDFNCSSEVEDSNLDIQECEIINNDYKCYKSSEGEEICTDEKIDGEVSPKPCEFEEKRKNAELSQVEETIQSSNKEEGKCDKTGEGKSEGNLQRKVEVEIKQHMKKEETREREIEKERERERLAVERAIREARERAFAEARERAAAEKAAAGAQQREAEGRQRLEKSSAEAKKSASEKAFVEAKLKAERAAVERATAEARERALEKALSEKAAAKAKNQADKFSGGSREERFKSTDKGAGSLGSSRYSSSSNRDGPISTSRAGEVNGESALRCKARFESHQRTAERAAKALAEKNMRDLLAQKEQAERNRLAETLDADVKRWSSGKERNLRALLSTLQYILGPDSGWQPTPLTELISTNSVKKAYRKATLCVHPDKLQQRGATIQQKYTCEKVFDLLKEAWNKFSAEER